MVTQAALFSLLFVWPCGVRAAAPAGGPADGDWDARITRVEGTATVLLAGKPDEGVVTAKKGMPLNAGDTLATGPDSRVEAALDPDNILELGPGSRMSVEASKKSDCVLGLRAGHVVAKLKLLVTQRFRVRTPMAVASVRGTEFAVELVDGDGKSEPRTVVGVFDDGKLAVSALGDPSAQERLLTRDEEAEFFDGKPPSPVRRLEFLKARAERVKAFRARMTDIREQFKRYSQESRERIRRKMEKGPRMRPERLRRLKDKPEGAGRDTPRDGLEPGPNGTPPGRIGPKGASDEELRDEMEKELAPSAIRP